MICALTVLLADVAAAANQHAGNALQLHLRSTSFELPRQPNAMPSSFLRARGGGRHKPGTQRGFSASTPIGMARSIDARSAGATTFAFDRQATSGTFHFERSGGDVTKIVPRSYNKMCETLSDHIWNDPKGKRVSFDMNGKPGIAIEIPIN
jgi:hypothetical protein